MLSVIAALFLSIIPPNNPLPQGLELCIHKAEVCALEAALPVCGDDADRQACIESFEDCMSAYPEAYEPSCRMEYGWCKLELSDASPKEYRAHCEAVFETCPTL